MAVMTEPRNDDRIDALAGEVIDLGRRVDVLDVKVDGLGERMDERFAQVDQRFAQVDQRFERVGEELREQRHVMKAGFEQVDANLRDQQKETNARLDGVQRAIVIAAVALPGAFIAGFAALIGLVATQL